MLPTVVVADTRLKPRDEACLKIGIGYSKYYQLSDYQTLTGTDRHTKIFKIGYLLYVPYRLSYLQFYLFTLFEVTNDTIILFVSMFKLA